MGKSHYLIWYLRHMEWGCTFLFNDCWVKIPSFISWLCCSYSPGSSCPVLLPEQAASSCSACCQPRAPRSSQKRCSSAWHSPAWLDAEVSPSQRQDLTIAFVELPAFAVDWLFQPTRVLWMAALPSTPRMPSMSFVMMWSVPSFMSVWGCGQCMYVCVCITWSVR